MNKYLINNREYITNDDSPRHPEGSEGSTPIENSSIPGISLPAFGMTSTLDNNKNYLFDLSYLTALELKGDNSAQFLQGQLTCDVQSVSDIRMVQGAQCDLKGRVLALMDVINWQGFKLILPKDLAELTRSSLIKTAMLSRVSINENNKLKIFGFYNQDPQDIIPLDAYLTKDLYAQSQHSNYCCYHLGLGFYIFIIDASIEDSLTEIFKQKNQLVGSLSWHYLRLKNRQFEIYPKSRALFLPHRLGLHLTEFISFNKGCYKGQEIIARTHYRATIKHELKLFTVESPEPIYSGQKLFKESSETEIGELVDYVPVALNKYLVAITMLKEAEPVALFQGHTGSLQLKSED